MVFAFNFLFYFVFIFCVCTFFVQQKLGGNNTNILYVHYNHRAAIPSLEIEGGNIQYYSIWESNIVITPNSKLSNCTASASKLEYSWQQRFEFPTELSSEISMPWPQTDIITKYQFNFNPYSKSLWIDTFEFYSSFNGNFTTNLPSAYFKLTVTQYDDEDNYIASLNDYVAIQFVFDLPLPYATYTVVHNVDNVLTLSIHDFFKFSELLMTDDWIINIYQFN